MTRRVSGAGMMTRTGPGGFNLMMTITDRVNGTGMTTTTDPGGFNRRPRA